MNKPPQFLGAFVCVFALFGRPAVVSAKSGQTLPKPAVFTTHLNSEPQLLDPHLQTNSSSSYLTDNLFRNFFWYDDKKGFVPDLAEKCVHQKNPKNRKNQVICTLRENSKWSNGESLTAKHFIDAYRRILTATNRARRADLLFPIVGAEEFYLGKLSFDKVGLTQKDDRTLIIELKNPDPDFDFVLSSPAFGPLFSEASSAGDPVRAEALVTSGPFQIHKWTPGQSLELTPNPFYWKKKPRTSVKFYFIPDDAVALKLYERGELDFLRRLMTQFMPVYQKKPDYFTTPAFRFDYIGFGPQLKDDPSFRKALIYSLDYVALQKLFHSEGLFGCPGLPKNSYDTVPTCYQFDLIKAKKFLADSLWAKAPTKKRSIQMFYSSQGGDDHQRLANWLQIQWKKNIGVDLEVRSIESRVMLQTLRSTPPEVFRRGIAPAIATCSSVLRVFLKDSPENFLQHFDLGMEKFLGMVDDGVGKSSICQMAMTHLMNQHVMIPTGAYHFAQLMRPGWKGFSINSLNSIDLSEIQKE